MGRGLVGNKQGPQAQAAAALPGKHDFSAFRVSGGSPGHAVREVFQAAWQQGAEGRLRFTITANGFLRGMVRSLVGTMVEIGIGKRPAADLAALLKSCDRSQAGATAPAQGLFLVEVRYDEVGEDESYPGGQDCS